MSEPEKKELVRTHIVHDTKERFTFCGKAIVGELVAYKSHEMGSKTPWPHPVCHACIFAHQKFAAPTVARAAQKQAEKDAQRHPTPEPSKLS